MRMEIMGLSNWSDSLAISESFFLPPPAGKEYFTLGRYLGYLRAPLMFQSHGQESKL